MPIPQILSRGLVSTKLLWGRLQPLLPPPRDRFPADQGPRLEPDIGHWRWAGCNDFDRFYEYGLGDELDLTSTSRGARRRTRRSLPTVLVYLSTGKPCEGGETVVEGHAIVARPGRVAVFDHRLVHAGQLVPAGRKLVLRNDVIAEV